MSNPDYSELFPQPTGNEESFREHGRQLALDALLRAALETPKTTIEPAAAVPTARRSHRLIRWAIAASAMGLAVWMLPWDVPHKNADVPPGAIAKNDPELPHPMAAPKKAAPPNAESTAELEDWRVEPSAGAVFHVASPTKIVLEQGDLAIAPVSGTDRHDLIIETPVGIATANSAAEFVIGTTTPSHSTGSEDHMLNLQTHVLVLAGVVSLATSFGTQTGSVGQLLAAEPSQPPTKLAVASNNGFAFDLYHEIARDDAAKNLFFSPYSVSVALTMTAEGARGETAEQMAQVLHIPEDARRAGRDSATVPYNLALIHAGHASLNQRWSGDKSRDSEIHKQIAALRKDLAAANNEVARLQKSNKFDDA
jgi:hypothetical protein